MPGAQDRRDAVSTVDHRTGTDVLVEIAAIARVGQQGEAERAEQQPPDVAIEQRAARPPVAIDHHQDAKVGRVAEDVDRDDQGGIRRDRAAVDDLADPGPVAITAKGTAATHLTPFVTPPR